LFHTNPLAQNRRALGLNARAYTPRKIPRVRDSLYRFKPSHGGRPACRHEPRSWRNPAHPAKSQVTAPGASSDVSSRRDSRSHAASRVAKMNTNRRHVIGDHRGRSARWSEPWMQFSAPTGTSATGPPAARRRYPPFAHWDRHAARRAAGHGRAEWYRNRWIRTGRLELVVALGTSGTVASLVRIVQLWLHRDRRRSLTVSLRGGSDDRVITVEGDNISIDTLSAALSSVGARTEEPKQDEN